jgi:hypothetical protein
MLIVDPEIHIGSAGSPDRHWRTGGAPGAHGPSPGAHADRFGLGGER